MSFRLAEYAAIRQAIADRGQLRLTLGVTGLFVWAALLVAVLVWLPYPVAAVVPLVPLLAAFEAMRSLHAGAERLGRYLQVFYEEGDAGDRLPGWERTAMALGPTVPGAAGHPLLLGPCLAAVGLNLLAVLLPGPVPVELALLGLPHVLLTGWMLRADQAMRRQRGDDLARLRAIRAGGGPGDRP